MSFWAAISALVTALGFGMALVLHIVNFAYKHGKAETRMEVLAASVKEVKARTETLETAQAGVATQIALVNSSIGRLQTDIGDIKGMVGSFSEELEQTIRGLLVGQFKAPGRRAAKAAAE